MATVFDAANFLIALTNERIHDDYMTNLRLNKLLYFAQGQYLAKTGRPLFNSSFEAWPYGPVVPDIYHKYKVCGRSPVTEVDETYSEKNLTQDEISFLLDIVRCYGKYATNELVERSHEPGSPWEKAQQLDACHQIINEDEMRAYFSRPDKK